MIALLVLLQLIFFFLLSFLGLHPRHMKVHRLGIKSELQQPACTTAEATPDLSHISDLHHSSRQGRILNPLGKARDRTRDLMVPSRIRFHCATAGTPYEPHIYSSFTFHFNYSFSFTNCSLNQQVCQ